MKTGGRLGLLLNFKPIDYSERSSGQVAEELPGKFGEALGL